MKDLNRIKQFLLFSFMSAFLMLSTLLSFGCQIPGVSSDLPVEITEPKAEKTDESEKDKSEEEKTVKEDETNETAEEIKEENTETEVEEEPVFEPADIANLPEGLEHFLCGVNWADNYDCESEESIRFSVKFMLTLPYDFCDFSLYSDYLYVPDAENLMDDSQFFMEDEESDYSGFYVYDADGVDWILKNIYNINDTYIGKIKDPEFLQTSSGSFYYQDGNYYVHSAGIGGGFICSVKYAEKSGDLYHIIYSVSDAYMPEKSTDKYAIMEYKTFNGKGYWSIFKDSADPIFDIPEDLTFIQEQHIYTDDELTIMSGKWAEDYYNYVPTYIDVDYISDTEVSIHLYDIVEQVLDDGEISGHTATLEWLTIDCTTGQGTNLNGEPVDLSVYNVM